MPSKIIWTEETWNPVFGCTKVSAGCTHCYALAMAHRLDCMGRPQYHGITKKVGDDLQWSGVVRTDENLLHKPLGWKKPKRIFVCSMADLFHDDVPDEFILQVFDVMRKANWHTFQVLTKRAQRMEGFINGCLQGDVPSNVWVGVTVENQEQADKRIPYLTMIDAEVRFLSIEPMLGEIDLERYMYSGCATQLDWMICGGESGPDARPMHPDWARQIRGLCAEHEIPFLFKQWGTWFPREEWEHNDELILPDDCDAYTNSPTVFVFSPDDEPVPMHKVGKHKAGRLLDGQLHDGYPEVQ